ncbi:heparan-alpha-glucosaminide N-acetyltransferase domain-containing protein [Brevibacillus halotolerans]|uniref:DUF418 domain-containing protein n=1 Tax=Brevibacillus TaxID=55080 RepID=UPI00215B95BA|nr:MULTISPECIES: heparan-alpha-glucosaminide N-acetyltransferase domain-containing protein [Brevibacillus]MCR8964921.1 heparan-alpha-glucosaminide N-acetyltransferase domain-containing protein [Brevibacillus laterosporus]MCZ0837076.1 heparan-alpha-glucosaminide N-acetyltransferase domain-containing protein [Brevibacillus halotolerans]
MTLPSTRILGFDFARAWAILGMIIVNYSTVMNAGTNGPDWLVALASLLQGRASTIFVIVAGIGISLMTKKARNSNNPAFIRQNRSIIWKRALFLFLSGILLYLCSWTGDILHYYGVYMFAGSFLIAASSRSLLLSVVGILVTSQLLQLVFHYGIGWDPLQPIIHYVDFWTLEGFFRNLLFNGYHPVFPWVGFFLLGMWLGRQDLANKVCRRKLLICSAIVAIAVEILSSILIQHIGHVIGTDTAEYFFSTTAFPPTIFYFVSGSSTSILVILLSVYFAERCSTNWFTQTMVSTGQLALTHYVGHVFIGFSILQYIGRLENQTLAFAVSYSLAFFVIAAVLSAFWRNKYSRGPLESLMRKCSG